MFLIPQVDTVRVLAAYGLDDTLKLDQERIFVKSIFLLQIFHPDDLKVPEDTIIHDLEIVDVRFLNPTPPTPAPYPFPLSAKTLLFSPDSEHASCYATG